jgi:hypothetical protein
MKAPSFARKVETVCFVYVVGRTSLHFHITKTFPDFKLERLSIELLVLSKLSNCNIVCTILMMFHHNMLKPQLSISLLEIIDVL